MATKAETLDLSKIQSLSVAAQRKVMQYAQGVLTKHAEFSSIRNKMDAIDIAYARYKAKAAKNTDGKDIREGDVGCNVFADDDVTPPIVVSQVDSYVAYLAEVFLSGSPLFPVSSMPSKRLIAESLEAIIDDHASLGAYPRQLLLFLRDGVKYNLSAIELEWDTLDQFSVLQDVGAATGQRLDKTAKKFNRITRLNPRNMVWDWSVAPGDVACAGDYAGYIKRVSRTKFKRLLNRWSKDRKAMNVEAALSTGSSAFSNSTIYYTEDPQISDYVQTPGQFANASPNWDAWFEPGKGNNGRRGPPVMDAMYELFTIYARIMPADMGISAPQPNTPQIWKFIICNGQQVVYADRIISAYDYLPILFGQPLEDGLGYQTQSIAEGEIPFQEAANTLFNIRFAAARRAVSDRALYIPDMIKPSDINSKVPAPKIPVHISALSQKSISDAYHQIPFDLRGTETTIQDASLIVQFSKELHGVNNPRQGQFQKGNKSVKEWNDTMSGSDGRMRLPALILEHQVFVPMKNMIALNIIQYGDDGVYTSQSSGRQLEVKISELRSAALSFKISDGYSPKAVTASTDVILAGMNMIMNSPLLQQSYGARLPAMFAHFMSLSGAKGFEQYDPNYENQQAANPTAANIQGNNLQSPGQPNPVNPTNPAVIPPVQQQPVQ
jgi:hypothetical protein